MPYILPADIRAVAGLDDVSIYPDDVVTVAITQAEELIDSYTGTSFTYKNFSETLDGTDTDTIRLRTLFPRTLTTVTVDGVAATPTGWALYDTGHIVRTTGDFTYTHPGRNVVVTGTAGLTSAPPEEIQWACRTLAISNLIQLESRIPDRALAVQNEYGQVQIAQAGGSPSRPTEFPSVNAVLNRWRQRPPLSF